MIYTGIHMAKKINVALIGCGVIGNAMREWLQGKSHVRMFVNDPAKEYTDDVYNSNMDAYFISINVPNLKDDSQDLKEIVKILRNIRRVNKTAPIWIRSTITLSSFEVLDMEFHVNFLPEFLSERTAVADFKRMKMIFTPTDRPDELKLLYRIFKEKSGTEMTSKESILVKYFHNIYGALKVTYFNCIKEICDWENASFDLVKKGMFDTGHISKRYTKVPGPDGKQGYGGKCFPKDTKAFLHNMHTSSFRVLLEKMPKLNRKFRGES